ncbi:MAG: hypothetical protein HZA94_03610 [Candidatus Vogelbacteria bacterium]|nr:hypothetical protein [Candidatus Vogelbacteria bacterium]
MPDSKTTLGTLIKLDSALREAGFTDEKINELPGRPDVLRVAFSLMTINDFSEEEEPAD